MGMVLSDSTNKTGLYENFQDLTNTNPTSYSLYKYVRDANNAYANFNILALMASQKWEHDDTNQTDYPIMTVNLVSGQQDYSFTNDASTVPNQVLDILRVEISDSSGNWTVLTPYDQTEEIKSLTQSATVSGTPTRYDKLANAIWLDAKPNYSLSNGLKIYFGRTPVYFIGDGTTPHNAVVPGIPDAFHPYLFLLPAYNYCIIKLPRLAPGYLQQVRDMEAQIAKFYFWRNRDEKKRMKANVENNR